MPLYHMLQRGGKYGRKYIGISYRVVAEKSLKEDMDVISGHTVQLQQKG